MAHLKEGEMKIFDGKNLFVNLSLWLTLIGEFFVQSNLALWPIKIANIHFGTMSSIDFQKS